MRILRVFLGADLRCGHDGLAESARKAKINVTQLGTGEYVLFINNTKTKIKLYTAGGVLAYRRLDKGQVFDLRFIEGIPRAFESKGRLTYDDVVKESLGWILNRVKRK